MTNETFDKATGLHNRIADLSDILDNTKNASKHLQCDFNLVVRVNLDKRLYIPIDDELKADVLDLIKSVGELRLEEAKRKFDKL